MAVYDLLKAEVQRGLRLLRRSDSIPEHRFHAIRAGPRPEYLHKIKFNIEKLKKEGLIRFACADTFSGEGTYLRQMRPDVLMPSILTSTFADDQGKTKVLPTAKAGGLGSSRGRPS